MQTESPVIPTAPRHARKHALAKMEPESTVIHVVPIVGSRNSFTEFDSRQTESKISAANRTLRIPDTAFRLFFTGKRAAIIMMPTAAKAAQTTAAMIFFSTIALHSPYSFSVFFSDS